MAGEQRISIDDLVAETENITFDIVGSNPEEGFDEVLSIVDNFREESKRKLYVIEEERRKTVFIDGAFVDVDDEVVDDEEEIENDEGTGISSEDGAESNCQQNRENPGAENTKTTNEKEQEAAMKTMREIKKALKGLRSFDVNDKELKERGAGIRLRTSSNKKLDRPISSFPILESTKLFNEEQKPNKPQFDMNSLNQELANLLTMADSPVDPSLLEREEPISPCTIPATPPSTPARNFTSHPLSPSELMYMRSNSLSSSQPQEVNSKPPPKPPRQHVPPSDTPEEETNLQGNLEYDQSNNQLSSDQKVTDQNSTDMKSDDQISDQTPVAGQVPAGAPPPKPPRLNSVNTIDKLKLQMGKFSKSMGNLAFAGDTQAKTSSPEPTTPQISGTENGETGLRIGEKFEKIFSPEKMGKVFSKFNFMNTKKTRGLSIGDPSDFKHLATSGKEAEDPADEQLSLLSNEQPTATFEELDQLPSETQKSSISEAQTNQEVEDVSGQLNSAFVEESESNDNVEGDNTSGI